jgi:hypothetical protein
VLKWTTPGIIPQQHCDIYSKFKYIIPFSKRAVNLFSIYPTVLLPDRSKEVAVKPLTVGKAENESAYNSCKNFLAELIKIEAIATTTGV